MLNPNNKSLPPESTDQYKNVSSWIQLRQWHRKWTPAINDDLFHTLMRQYRGDALRRMRQGYTIIRNHMFMVVPQWNTMSQSQRDFAVKQLKQNIDDYDEYDETQLRPDVNYLYPSQDDYIELGKQLVVKHIQQMKFYILNSLKTRGNLHNFVMKNKKPYQILFKQFLKWFECERTQFIVISQKNLYKVKQITKQDKFWVQNYVWIEYYIKKCQEIRKIWFNLEQYGMQFFLTTFICEMQKQNLVTFSKAQPFCLHWNPSKMALIRNEMQRFRLQEELEQMSLKLQRTQEKLRFTQKQQQELIKQNLPQIQVQDDEEIQKIDESFQIQGKCQQIQIQDDTPDGD